MFYIFTSFYLVLIWLFFQMYCTFCMIIGTVLNKVWIDVNENVYQNILYIWITSYFECLI